MHTQQLVLLALSLLTQYPSLSCMRAGPHHVPESGQVRTFADSLELETDTYVHSNLCIEREVWYIPKISLDICQNTMLYVRTYLTYSIYILRKQVLPTLPFL